MSHYYQHLKPPKNEKFSSQAGLHYNQHEEKVLAKHITCNIPFFDWHIFFPRTVIAFVIAVCSAHLPITKD